MMWNDDDPKAYVLMQNRALIIAVIMAAIVGAVRLFIFLF